eukprot:jgi/Botrbrau1/6044/Bobra.0042s0027.1
MALFQGKRKKVRRKQQADLVETKRAGVGQTSARPKLQNDETSEAQGVKKFTKPGTHDVKLAVKRNHKRKRRQTWADLSHGNCLIQPLVTRPSSPKDQGVYLNGSVGLQVGAVPEEQDLSPEELERRKRQRSLQERALKLRAEGKTYDRWKAKRQWQNQQRRQDGHGSRPAKQSRKKPGKRDFQDEEGSRPEGVVQVIIVPIYWNKKAEEKALVINAAERVAQLLGAANVATGLDTTNQLTPGQKFKYWEEKGVKLRVELGPRDAQAGTAVLAQCTNPGEVAQKTSLQADEALLAAIQEQLGLPKSLPSGAASAADPMPSEKKTTARARQKRSRDGQDTEPVPPPVLAQKTASGLVKSGLKASGDDLDDDFGENLDLEVDDDGGSRRKKKKKSKRVDRGTDVGQQGVAWASEKKEEKRGEIESRCLLMPLSASHVATFDAGGLLMRSDGATTVTMGHSLCPE